MSEAFFITVLNERVVNNKISLMAWSSGSSLLINSDFKSLKPSFFKVTPFVIPSSFLQPLKIREKTKIDNKNRLLKSLNIDHVKNLIGRCLPSKDKGVWNLVNC